MKLLVVLSRVPWPLDKGDKLRAYHQIKQLSTNHQIELIALNDKPLHPDAKAELSQFCDKIHILKLTKTGIAWNIIKAFFQGKPLQIGYFYCSKAHSEIKKIIREYQPDHIYAQLVRVAEYVRYENVSKTLDYQDALSAGLKRRRDKESGLRKLLFGFEFQRLKKYESDIFPDFDYKTIITAQDRALIDHPDKNSIVVLPNGVDMQFYHPMDEEKIYDLVFTGNMNYPPNVMAAKFLVNDILPLVQKQKKDVNVLIAGASPHPSVRALASEWVTVSGWVDDIRIAYASSRIFVAPMQIGTGLQNKLLEAMAMKLPSVTSDLANAALGAKAEQEIKVAPAQEKNVFAKHILDLLEHPDKANKQADQAFQFVLKNYSWKSSVEILEGLFYRNNS